MKTPAQRELVINLSALFDEYKEDAAWWSLRDSEDMAEFNDFIDWLEQRKEALL
jgi:hypothetical protein